MPQDPPTIAVQFPPPPEGAFLTGVDEFAKANYDEWRKAMKMSSDFEIYDIKFEDLEKKDAEGNKLYRMTVYIRHKPTGATKAMRAPATYRAGGILHSMTAGKFEYVEPELPLPVVNVVGTSMAFALVRLRKQKKIL